MRRAPEPDRVKLSPAWMALACIVSMAASFAAAPPTPLSAQDASPPDELSQLPPPDATPPGQTVIPDPDQFEAAAPTDDPELEADVRKLARQLRCPTCQALSIADSPSELAREMEGVIRLRLQEGMTPEEVRDSFVEAYGEWVLLSPDPRGFNLLVYILPFAVFLLGGGIVVVGMRRWLSVGEEEGSGTGSEGESGPGASPPPPAGGVDTPTETHLPGDRESPAREKGAQPAPPA